MSRSAHRYRTDLNSVVLPLDEDELGARDVEARVRGIRGGMGITAVEVEVVLCIAKAPIMSEGFDVWICAFLQAAALMLFDSSVVGRIRSAELKVDLIKEFEMELKNKKTENQVSNDVNLVSVFSGP